MAQDPDSVRGPGMYQLPGAMKAPTTAIIYYYYYYYHYYYYSTATTATTTTTIIIIIINITVIIITTIITILISTSKTKVNTFNISGEKVAQMLIRQAHTISYTISEIQFHGLYACVCIYIYIYISVSVYIVYYIRQATRGVERKLALRDTGEARRRCDII